jgi:hypothetical protein
MINLKKITPQNRVIIKHSLIWCLILSYFLLFTKVDCSKSSIVIFAIPFIATYQISYYFIYFIVTPWAMKQKYLLVIIGYMLSYAIFLILDMLNYKLVFPTFLIKTRRDNLDNLTFLRYSSFNYVFILIPAYAYMISQVNIANAKFTAQKIQDGLKRELGILKQQFLSHMHFNFLHFCYAGLIKVAPDKSMIVENYYEVLSYSLKHFDIRKVKLSEEVNYIDHLIQIQKTLNPGIDIQFQKKFIDNEFLIPSLSLSNIIEQFVMRLDNKQKLILSLSNRAELIELKITCQSSTSEVTDQYNHIYKMIFDLLDFHFKESYTLKSDSKNHAYSIDLNIALKQ